MTISVIMSTYHRERPENLDTAMKSIWTDQTRKPDQIVLVEDGLLTPQLNEIVEKWKGVIGDALKVVDNKVNKGLAASLNDAIENASGELLARMDSDDISCPDRFRLQEEYMTSHPDVDILGGGLQEFDDAGTRSSIRIYPATMQDVKARIHRLAPLAHPSVMFRKRFFDDGFRYNSKYYLCEDITLWFNAVNANRVINNIPEVVINFRLNPTTMSRRRSKAWAEFCAYNEGIYAMHGLFTTCYIFSCLRFAFRMMPSSIVNATYKLQWFRNRLAKS